MNPSNLAEQCGIEDSFRPMFDDAIASINDRIDGLGYEDACELMGGEFGGEDPSSIFGLSGCNVIPSDVQGSCARLLIAFSKGSSKNRKLGFPMIMQEVKAHLTKCHGTTQAVVFYCTAWDSDKFAAEHVVELKAHYARGVRFVFILVGVPGNACTVVPVDLK
jgi:hypothetical protein